jgi:hypothetical protein
MASMPPALGAYDDRETTPVPGGSWSETAP